VVVVVVVVVVVMVVVMVMVVAVVLLKKFINSLLRKFALGVKYVFVSCYSNT
jgi:hypothetical protein